MQRFMHHFVCSQKLFQVSPEGMVDEQRLKQLVRGCTIFNVMPTEQSDGFEVQFGSPSLPSLSASDVEYLYQAPCMQNHQFWGSDGS